MRGAIQAAMGGLRQVLMAHRACAVGKVEDNLGMISICSASMASHDPKNGMNKAMTVPIMRDLTTSTGEPHTTAKKPAPRPDVR